MRFLAVLVLLLCASVALAAPSKKEGAAFVKELESAVKANKKILSGRTPEAIRGHNAWYQRLQAEGDRLFTQAGACSFAAGSAASLWSSLEQYDRHPDQLGYKFNQRRQEDYRENLKACKESLGSLK